MVRYLVTEVLPVVDGHQADHGGWPPPHAAAIHGHLALMKGLMSYAALLDAKKNGGE